LRRSARLPPIQRGDRVSHTDGRTGGKVLDRLGPLVLVEWPDRSVTSHELTFGMIRPARSRRG